MQPNVGGVDRIVRIIVAVGLLVAAFILPRRTRLQRLLRYAVIYAGLDLLVTSLLRRCPVNYVLGVNTCERSVPEEIVRLNRRYLHQARRA